MKDIAVLLADDHAMFREGLAQLLSKQPDIRVAAEASNGEEVLGALEKDGIDVVLLDIRMPGLDGLKTCREIKARFPQVQVVMLTMYDDDELVVGALRAGACGFVLKESSSERLIEAIHAASNGKVTVSPELVGTLVAEIRRAGEQEPVPIPPRLSERDLRILSMVSDGTTNRRIAEILGLSEQTIKNNLSLVYQKLAVRNRIEAIRAIERLGIRLHVDEDK